MEGNGKGIPNFDVAYCTSQRSATKHLDEADPLSQRPFHLKFCPSHRRLWRRGRRVPLQRGGFTGEGLNLECRRARGSRTLRFCEGAAHRLRSSSHYQFGGMRVLHVRVWMKHVDDGTKNLSIQLKFIFGLSIE